MRIYNISNFRAVMLQVIILWERSAGIDVRTTKHLTGLHFTNVLKFMGFLFSEAT